MEGARPPGSGCLSVRIEGDRGTADSTRQIPAVHSVFVTNVQSTHPNPILPPCPLLILPRTCFEMQIACPTGKGHNNINSSSNSSTNSSNRVPTTANDHQAEATSRAPTRMATEEAGGQAALATAGVIARAAAGRGERVQGVVVVAAAEGVTGKRASRRDVSLTTK